MLLRKIIKNLEIDIQKINIEGLSLDSRQIKKNYLFFAIKGTKHNGEDYIFNAIKKGAAVIVCDKNCKIKNIKMVQKILIHLSLYFQQTSQNTSYLLF